MDYTTSHHESVHHPHLLIRALESFISPLLQAHVISRDHKRNIQAEVRSRVLDVEAQNLLFALEKFVIALVLPPEEDEGIGISPASEISQNNTLLPTFKTRIDSPDRQPVITHPRSVNQPLLLTVGLEGVREHIFNKLPIRLLSFKSDGSGIELLERDAIWDRVSKKMVREFDERVYLNNHPSLEYALRLKSADFNHTVIQPVISRYTNFSIMSHTWLRGAQGEVTYNDWKDGNLATDSTGYRKLINFCRISAMDHGVTLGWMDTICINKDSSAELDESIRSMYKWYSDASVCITHLADTAAMQDMHNDRWFTRGWTLQELIAPRYTKFYGRDWEKIVSGSSEKDDRALDSIEAEICAATSISRREYYDDTLKEVSFDFVSISRKMQWASNRKVTREEDASYSLMGLFGVSISVAYGEGSKSAFLRLVREILNTNTNVLDIVNWGIDPTAVNRDEHLKSTLYPITPLIPSSPQQYLWRAIPEIRWFSLATPLTLSHLGLHLSILLMPAISVDPTNPESSFVPFGQYYGRAADVKILHTRIVPNNSMRDTQSSIWDYNVLDRSNYNPFTKQTGWDPEQSRYSIYFGVLNWEDAGSTIILPASNAFALCFHKFRQTDNSLLDLEHSLKQFPTTRPITFDIRSVGETPHTRKFAIPKKDLEKHGIRLVAMHL
ncbi:hypothetical protein BDN70DRAFT_874037 [Pholiota conissans]|uniref:Heterokaryon incompatibility domain-containing protein n=1 Tax=Pholiota conissans TaxID=109636 RepID=A0A9P5Z9C9_9AGAR|nr:hypothetical protein BDN70DRAFT_874037 [Pholiota conissans]